MKWELDKLLRRFLLWLPVASAVILRVILLAADSADPPFQRQSLTDEYNGYMAFLSGPLTDEKQAFFDDETARRDADKAFYDTIFAEMAGEHTPEEQAALDEEFSAYRPTAQVSDEVWMILSERLKTVQTDPANRWFFQEGGWQRLLMHEELDTLLLAAILALSGLCFAREYECGMAPLLRTCRGGRRRLAWQKVAVVMALVAALTALVEGAALLFTRARFPLPDAPMQSVAYLETSPLSLTLWQVYALSRLARLGGALYLAALTMCVGVWTRHSLSALFAGLLCVTLPAMLWQNTRLANRLPLPGTLLRGNGIFRDGLGGGEIIAVTALSLLFTVALVELAVERYARQGGAS